MGSEPGQTVRTGPIVKGNYGSVGSNFHFLKMAPLQVAVWTKVIEGDGGGVAYSGPQACAPRGGKHGEDASQPPFLPTPAHWQFQKRGAWAQERMGSKDEGTDLS